MLSWYSCMKISKYLWGISLFFQKLNYTYNNTMFKGTCRLRTSPCFKFNFIVWSMKFVSVNMLSYYKYFFIYTYNLSVKLHITAIRLSFFIWNWTLICCISFDPQLSENKALSFLVSGWKYNVRTSIRYEAQVWFQ